MTHQFKCHDLLLVINHLGFHWILERNCPAGIKIDDALEHSKGITCNFAEKLTC